ncbi:hypothetical protein O9K51_07721 [Purpureocillium lavendulum]|uniref:Carnosine N-methyltransferase n=1 Tax=Purpureocillium lavendulum TaxID=1247861 RepID=A0AB34FNR4_9HYPO|nr:hypothetical protein O9K51_07721 [Purpureocillium lavendulum]
MRPATAITASWWLAAGLVSSALASRQNGMEQALGEGRPVDSVSEVHQVVMTVHQANISTSQRHHDEKARLLESLSRKNGKWTPSHPRHRLLDALHGFLKYKDGQGAEVKRLRDLYSRVSKSQKALLDHHLGYSSKFDEVELKLARNQALCDSIVDSALDFYEVPYSELTAHVREKEAAGRAADRISVSQALKHIVRDWTTEGEHERNSTFDCVLGFEVTINEWSMYMNVVYRFLEEEGKALEHSFYPFVEGWSHHATDADMHRKLSFPDVDLDPKAVLMTEGDFTTAFTKQNGHYDVVITYFFIDTARNLLSYFDNIENVLKPGGYWINLGPLLYGTAPFVQLSLEDIIKITGAMGFDYQDTDERCGVPTLEGAKVRGMEAIYGFDKKALTKNAYNAQFWVAKKQ